jgi:hypothetical protein
VRAPGQSVAYLTEAVTDAAGNTGRCTGVSRGVRGLCYAPSKKAEQMRRNSLHFRTPSLQVRQKLAPQALPSATRPRLFAGD